MKLFKGKSEGLPYDGLVRLGTFFLMIYFLVLLGRSIHRNYQFDAQLDEIRTEIAETRQHNEELKSLAEFYRSKAYRERQAREKLNLKHPGENVLVFSEEQIGEVPEGRKEIAAEEQKEEDQPNYAQWWNFFFRK